MEQKSSYYKKHWIKEVDVRQPLGNAFDGLRNHFLRTYPIIFTDDPSNYDQVKKYANAEPFVWLVDRSIDMPRIFPWWFVPNDDAGTVYQFPYIFKNSRKVKEWNKVQLVSTSANEHVMIRKNYICGVYDPYHGKKRFDMFFLGNNDSESFNVLSKKYPELTAVSSYNEALKKSTTELFWLIPEDVIVSPKFNFSYCPDDWSYKYIHVFRNDKYFDGIALFAKHIPVTRRELLHRFYTEKKEVKISATKPKPFDIVFISYNEPNADENYERLLKAFPRAKRVHGVKGIHQAHIEAAKLATTGMFWVVDGDAVVDSEFTFEIEQMAHYDRFSRSTVYVWKSKNPINELEYGYGGVKLLPRELTLNMDTSNPDMTTSISPSFKSMPAISNITAFNTDEFSTWRSAFRECVKLSSKIIDKQKDEETEARLETWCTIGADKPFGEYAIMGAIAGRKYGKANKKKPAALAKINDFDWLKTRFEKDLKDQSL